MRRPLDIGALGQAQHLSSRVAGSGWDSAVGPRSSWAMISSATTKAIIRRELGDLGEEDKRERLLRRARQRLMERQEQRRRVEHRMSRGL